MFMASSPPLPPKFALSTTQLQFSYTIGGQQPTSQSIGVSNSGSGTLTWNSTANTSWIALASAPNSLSVSVNPAGLAAGTYLGVISFSAPGAVSQTVTVTLTVGSPALPSIVVTLSSLFLPLFFLLAGHATGQSTCLNFPAGLIPISSIAYVSIRYSSPRDNIGL